MSLEVLVQVLADPNVLEHSLQLAGVFEPTRLLQLGDHGCLGVVTGTHVLHQPLGEHLAVELLEHVLVLDVLEHHHHLVQCIFQLSLLRVLAGLLEQDVTVLGKKLWTFAALTRMLCDGIVVDELSTGLVEGGNETGVVVEGREYQGVVLSVHLQDCRHVDLGLVERLLAKLLNCSKTLERAYVSI